MQDLQLLLDSTPLQRSRPLFASCYFNLDKSVWANFAVASPGDPISLQAFSSVFHAISGDAAMAIPVGVLVVAVPNLLPPSIERNQQDGQDISTTARESASADRSPFRCFPSASSPGGHQLGLTLTSPLPNRRRHLTFRSIITTSGIVRSD